MIFLDVPNKYGYQLDLKDPLVKSCTGGTKTSATSRTGAHCRTMNGWTLRPK